MNWNFIPARGAIGGVLVGFKNYLFDIVSWQHFQLCDVTIVRNQIDNLSWRLIVVYGSPYEDEKLGFIKELHMVMPTWVGPTLLGGGGVNLVRNQKGKSNGNINFSHASAFNGWINGWGLIEIKDASRSFTWSNNQECPIMATLDRVLASIEWNEKYPLASVNVLPRATSDHNPLIIEFGKKAGPGIYF
jgi:hypothetical protein